MDSVRRVEGPQYSGRPGSTKRKGKDSQGRQVSKKEETAKVSLPESQFGSPVKRQQKIIKQQHKEPSPVSRSNTRRLGHGLTHGAAVVAQKIGRCFQRMQGTIALFLSAPPSEIAQEVISCLRGDGRSISAILEAGGWLFQEREAQEIVKAIRSGAVPMSQALVDLVPYLTSKLTRGELEPIFSSNADINIKLLFSIANNDTLVLGDLLRRYTPPSSAIKLIFESYSKIKPKDAAIIFFNRFKNELPVDTYTNIMRSNESYLKPLQVLMSFSVQNDEFLQHILSSGLTKSDLIKIVVAIESGQIGASSAMVQFVKWLDSQQLLHNLIPNIYDTAAHNDVKAIFALFDKDEARAFAVVSAYPMKVATGPLLVQSVIEHGQSVSGLRATFFSLQGNDTEAQVSAIIRDGKLSKGELVTIFREYMQSNLPIRRGILPVIEKLRSLGFTTETFLQGLQEAMPQGKRQIELYAAVLSLEDDIGKKLVFSTQLVSFLIDNGDMDALRAFLDLGVVSMADVVSHSILQQGDLGIFKKILPFITNNEKFDLTREIIRQVIRLRPEEWQPLTKILSEVIFESTEAGVRVKELLNGLFECEICNGFSKIMLSGMIVNFEKNESNRDSYSRKIYSFIKSKDNAELMACFESCFPRFRNEEITTNQNQKEISEILRTSLSDESFRCIYENMESFRKQQGIRNPSRMNISTIFRDYILNNEKELIEKIGTMKIGGVVKIKGGRIGTDVNLSIVKEADNRVNLIVLGNTLGVGGFKKVKLGYSLTQQVGVARASIIKDIDLTSEEANLEIDIELAASRHFENARVPNTVRLREIKKENGKRGLLSHLYNGGDAFSFFSEETRTPLMKLSVLCDAANGIAAMHRLGFVHRDIKDQNLLVESLRDGTVRCDVSDYGFVGRAGIVCKDPCCTGIYRDPILNTATSNNPVEYTDKMDVFSFGVMIFNVMTTKKGNPSFLFLHEPNTDVVLAAKNELLKYGNGVSRLVARCIDPDPNKRPSMDQVLKELKSLKASESGTWW